MEHWSEMLRAWMAGGGVTQSELAARLGVSQTTVSGWLRGRMPSAAHAAQLSDVAGIPWRAFLPESGALPATDDADDQAESA